MAQIVNLYEPLEAHTHGVPPVVLRVFAKKGEHIAGGVPSVSSVEENYVLFSALPEELKEKVRTFVQTVHAGQ